MHLASFDIGGKISRVHDDGWKESGDRK